MEERPNLMQIHNTPPLQPNPRFPPHYRRFMISNRPGERVIVLSHISSLCKLPSLNFSTSFVKKSIHENKHSRFSLYVRFNLDLEHVSASLFFFFSPPRGLIAFTCHICFIPSNVIFPRYWEHSLAPRAFAWRY